MFALRRCFSSARPRTSCYKSIRHLYNSSMQEKVQVDVIIPVHNAASTIQEAVQSAMNQEIPVHLQESLQPRYDIRICVCCYNDRSTDDSWSILEKLSKEYERDDDNKHNKNSIATKLFLKTGEDGIGRGAGYARNRAIELNNSSSIGCEGNGHHFLCLLDSDDTMHIHRVAEQTNYMLQNLTDEQRRNCILGCTFDRDPPDSTWHYSAWANSLTDERLMLERFREVTILQPTWFMCRSRWESLGGYIEAPLPSTTTSPDGIDEKEKMDKNYKHLIHPMYDNSDTLKLAEDLRFFHEHLMANGILRLHRTPSNIPLVTYRHSGTSQSFRTSRKLLLQLRVLAFERSILQHEWLQASDHIDDSCNHDGRFIVWGAGRDGKDFVKSLSKENRKRIYCFVDVDEKKLDIGRYMNRDLDVNVPIIHFSFLIKDPDLRSKIQYEWEEGLNTNDTIIGRIDKSKNTKTATDYGNDDDAAPPEAKRQKTLKRNSSKLQIRELSSHLLRQLPVVVCVAMYRTNGVLERNVKTVGRTEGLDLWHFS